jgi:molecular chaperone GrpE
MMDEKDTESEAEFIPEEEELRETEEIDEETGEGMMKDKLKSLREKVKLCEEEKRANLEELQRIRADFLNSKRRLEEQFSRDRERAADKIILDLLTLADSFDTARADEALWKTIDERWRIGVEAMHAQLLGILKSYGVVPIDPKGEAFNPEEHEAVSNKKVEEGDADRIVAVLQKGFKRNGTILRPAKVVVSTL